LINDPESDIADIARAVSTDPALTADLLKVVNSAQYMLPKKVDNIVDGVKMVGMRGLKLLLYSYGTQKVLGTDTEDVKRLWDHSYRTAFYAYNLAKSVTKKREILDDVYVGGILHDMGKIIFSSVHPELIDRINDFCREKGIPVETFEDLSAGLNHSEIGAMIAKKWNFPEALINAIKFHHTPTVAPVEYRDVVFTVYLANALAHFGEDEIGIDQIDNSVLEWFRIQSEEQMSNIERKLDELFARQAAS
jgi:putative nucleotidyltransferase with HDIG domain